MLWGKLIDHDRCIGCHACSVACKSENQVPLGVFRTWVKQVEKGTGPNVRRHFGVLRCNQCDQPPCVEICPTAAMHRRPDGIVDFDHQICIGCKACIQACPYDAIYIDPESQTAAKCNFCAHRIEVGLEPACVAACPTDALLVSDLHDPNSPVALTVGRQAVQVRKPELGTNPKVFYKGADQSVLDPHAALRNPTGIWGESRGVGSGVQPEGRGPRHLGAPAAARVAYDVPREGPPWGSKISSYLLAKAIAGGALMVGGLPLALGGNAELLGIWPPLLGLCGLALTMLLLVADLKRPDRFMLLLLKPQSRSWLVKGTYVLLFATVVAAAWGLLLLLRPDAPPWIWRLLGWLGILGGGAAAGYTALLFWQARARRLWQSALLLPHLVVQAGLAGSAALAILPGSLWDEAQGGLLTLGKVMAICLALNLVMLLGELWSHSDEDGRLAMRWMTSGERGTTLYLGVLALGHVFPAVAIGIALVAPGAEAAVVLGGVAALMGVFLWDHLYVTAGQIPPLS